MNENERIIILAMAKRLEELGKLVGFLFPENEEKVLAALRGVGVEFQSVQDFARMANSLRDLSKKEIPDKKLPNTSELKSNIIKEYRLNINQ